MKRKWMGTKPTRCDICNERFTDNDKHFFDFAMRQGKWALGCQECFDEHGVGLGAGQGQKYDLSTLEKVEPIEQEPVGPVKSLAELKTLAENDSRYADMVKLASKNIGGPSENLEEAYDWLATNAYEVSEEAVIDEVNDCIGLYYPTIDEEG